MKKEEILKRANQLNKLSAELLWKENRRLRSALEAIIKHQEFVAGTAAPYSTTLKIAKEALYKDPNVS